MANLKAEAVAILEEVFACKAKQKTMNIVQRMAFERIAYFWSDRARLTDQKGNHHARACHGGHRNVAQSMRHGEAHSR